MAKTVTLLRLEDGNGHGPFSPLSSLNGEAFCEQVGWCYWYDDFFSAGIATSGHDHPHHNRDCLGGGGAPGLFGGEPIHLPGRWKVAAANVEQFLHWFPAKALAWLEAQGMVVKRYEVPVKDAKVCSVQAMFRASKAKVIETLKPTDLIKENTL